MLKKWMPRRQPFRLPLPLPARQPLAPQLRRRSQSTHGRCCPPRQPLVSRRHSWIGTNVFCAHSRPVFSPACLFLLACRAVPKPSPESTKESLFFFFLIALKLLLPPLPCSQRTGCGHFARGSSLHVDLLCGCPSQHELIIDTG